MAIVKIYRMTEKCDVTEDGPVVTREYKFGDNFVASDPTEFLYTSYTSAGYPPIGARYDGADEIFVSNIQAVRTGEDKVDDNGVTLYVWKVTIEWSPTEFEEHEYDEWYEVSYRCEGVDLDGRYDWNNAPNINSCGEFFTDKLPTQAPIVVINVTCASAGPPITSLYKKTNGNKFWGYPPNYWLCRDVTGQWINKKSWGYWKNSYEFAYNPLTWYLFKADAGFYHLGTIGTSETETLVRTLDGEGAPCEVPRLLDGTGHLLGNSSAPVMIYFKIYASAEFPYLPRPF